FTFENASMPAHDLILFAKWAKPVYQITFEPANGKSPWMESVEMFDSLEVPPDPNYSGYIFAGWYADQASLRYTFGFPVTESFTLTARWIKPEDVSYVVQYMKKNASGVYELYSKEYFTEGLLGETASASAMVIDGYLPDHLSKSLVLKGQGENNVIYFYYNPFQTVDYRIDYVDEEGVVLRESKQVTTNKAIETENYQYIANYVPDAYQITFPLSREASENVVVFRYTPAFSVNYLVEHYLQQSTGEYILKDSEVRTALAGTVVIPEPRSYSSYTYQAELSSNEGLIMADGSTVFKLYYKLNSDGSGESGGNGG
ncbi:MAG TPA: hypothetical protein DEQ64_03195, partial [Lachnoclostridium sp.]|nr:hypothetical protein [Lachnoclostridium sp.]